MDEQVWYLYQKGKQVGPFDANQVKQLFASNMISREGYLFKVGWKDWRLLEESIHELGVEIPGSEKASEEELARRRAQSPRATIKGRVDVHNGAQFSSGIGVNISFTGIFVETRDQIFNMGETLNLTVRCDGLDKPFNASAKVIRFNSDDRFPVGYGLRFEDLREDISEQIKDLVERQNLDPDDPEAAAN